MSRSNFFGGNNRYFFKKITRPCNYIGSCKVLLYKSIGYLAKSYAYNYLICSLSNTLFTAESNAHTDASIISFLMPQPQVVTPSSASIPT